MSGQLLRRLASKARVHDAPFGARRRMLLKRLDRKGSLFQSLKHALSRGGKILGLVCHFRGSDVKIGLPVSRSFLIAVARNCLHRRFASLFQNLTQQK